MPESEHAISKTGGVAVGHPVDVASGSVFTIQHDFSYAGTLLLDWRRRYSTASQCDGPLGFGWTVPYFMRLETVPGGYQLFDEDGGMLRFAAPQGTIEPGETVASFGANMQLRREADYFVITHWHYGSDDVERFYFGFRASGPMPLGAIENLQGHRITVQYDPRLRPTRIRQELEERELELVYGDDDLLASVQFVKDGDDRKLLVSYQYDVNRNLVECSDAMGARTVYQYDGQHRMTAETNCLGSTFRFEYDRRGRCIYSTGDDRYMERSLQYFSAPPMTRVKDSLGNTIDFYLNQAGLVIQEVTQSGGAWNSEYDEFGREIAQADPLGATVRYGYDDDGNRSTIVDENGSVTRLHYNDLHVLTQYTDPMGSTWSFERDERGNVLGVVDPLGRSQIIVRDRLNLVSRSITAAGREIVRRYGRALRWVEATDQISLISRMEFNDEGDQLAAYNAEGIVQRVRFDACHRPVEVLDKLGNSYRMRWNALGELVERTGPDIGWEKREYDRFGQLTKHSNPLGDMHFRYDTEGRMVEAVNRAGERMQFAYDAEGRMTAKRLFDGRIERCEYTARGLPERMPLADGRDVQHSYDAAGNLIGRESSDGLKERFSYDKNGNLIRAETPDTVVELSRDALGIVIAEVQNGWRVEYEHDADGNRTARRLPDIDAADLRRTNDVRGRLTTLTDVTGLCHELQWDNVDRIVQRRFSGGVEALSYDASGRIQSQRVQSHAVTFIERTYEYDPMDNIRILDESRRARYEFDYDQIGRLIAKNSGGQQQEYYQYDANGSITETHRGVRAMQAGGRTLNDGRRKLAYDENGCVSSIVDASLKLDLAYDVDGRLVEATSSSGMSAKYIYDALGRRAAKLVDGYRTDYLWEGFVLAAEGHDGRFSETFYFHALDPLAQWRNGHRLTPITDTSGLVREVLDERGSIEWECVAETYGQIVQQSTGRPSPFRLRGQYFDGETSLHFNFHRTYDPLLGNYLSPDPIGIEGGSNFYAYPRNPLVWDDPYGLSCGRRSCKAERKMTKAMNDRGYKLVSVRGKNAMANGIDGIYHNPDGTPQYIIAEAKSGCAVLRWSGPKDQNGKGTIQQMSDAWINGKPGASGETRLESALPPQADGTPNPHITAIQSGSAGPVGKEVYNPDKPPGQRTNTLSDYGGPGSNQQTI